MDPNPESPGEPPGSRRAGTLLLLAIGGPPRQGWPAFSQDCQNFG